MLTVINLTTTDPAFNLAAEQFVFDSLPKDRNYLMLWQNENAVIIGKYQNTAAQINEQYVRAHGIKVVRRLSGGGAVYHDLGNLNYTFITDAIQPEKLNMRIFCEPVVNALRELGVPAEINGRNDITIKGKKISGNAQYLREERVMHHGTLLFDSDLSAVDRALQVDREKIHGKGIESVRSRVTNIRPHLQEDVPLFVFREMLLKKIAGTETCEEYSFSEEDIREIDHIRKTVYDTWDWNYGRSPECSIQKSARIEGCGTIEAFLTTVHGRITDVRFYGDYFSAREPEELAVRFKGKKPDAEGYREALDGIDAGEYFSGLTNDQLIELLL